MNPVTPSSTVDPEGVRPGRRALIPVGIALFGSAGWLFFHAHYHWGAESYYNFGWVVPFLALYLLYRRLGTARFYRGGELHRRGWILLISGLAGVAGWILLVRLFNEANPFWRVPLWAYGLALLAFYYAILLGMGGKRSLAHFYFPLLFCLMALPWPWRLEQFVIQSLTRWVTDLTVTCLNLMGYPAVALGNTIRIGQEQVGVDEACSGIRSLQSLMMVSLFLGEYFFFKIPKRVVLVAGAVALMLVFNGMRAVTLAWVTVEGDPQAFDVWHDRLGHVSFIVSCALLFFLGDRLEGKARNSPSAPQWHLFWVGMSRQQALRFSLGILLAFLLVEGVVQTYYLYRESNNAPLPQLTIRWPDSGNPRFEMDSIPEPVAEVLKYDFGMRAETRWNDGLSASITYYGYTGEDRMASVSSYGHSPTVCLTAVGARLLEKKDPLTVELYGQSWPLNHYAFVFGEGSTAHPLQVFWLVWEPRQMGVDAEDMGSLTWRTHWKLVKSGRRHFGRQVLLVYFPGEHPPSLMRQRMKMLLETIVVE